MSESATPLFSIVTPVYDPPLDVLADTIASVRAQTCRDWEWVLCDDRSPDPRVREALHAAAAEDPRIVVVERAENGHIVKASNDALARARGEFVVFVDHDDLLVPDALAHFLPLVEAHPDLDYAYSDEDKLNPEGHFYDAFLKPDWSPERLRCQMYLGHLSIARRSLVEEVGGFREGYDGSQDHDLALRVTERARLVKHVPAVLYHWRVVPGSAAGSSDAKPYAREAGMKAVRDHLRRQGVEATVSGAERAPGTYVVTRVLPPTRRVAVVVPTAGDAGLVWGRRRTYVVEAVRSALARTAHREVEVVVVHDGRLPAPVVDELTTLGRPGQVRVVTADPGSEHARLVNTGVLATTAERVVLLDDATEALSEGWLEQLVAPLEVDGVGVTGAMLLDHDSTYRHVGWSDAHEGGPQPYVGRPSEDVGPFAQHLTDHEVSQVSVACAAVRRDLFLDLGGLSELLPPPWDGSDLCRKARLHGLRVVTLQAPRLHWFETRRPWRPAHPHEQAAHELRWGPPAARDAFTRQY